MTGSDGVPTGLVPLAGGWSGRTFRSDAGPAPQVVRVLDPGDNDQLHAQASLHRLVRGLVPVPEVLDVVPGDPEADRPGLLVTAWVAGERGDEVLAGAGDRVLRSVGGRLGAVAATLAGMPMLRAGRLVGDPAGGLDVEPWPGAVGAGLPEFVDERLPALAHWSATERGGLREVADAAESLLATVGRVSLVHSDLNPKNVLVDPDTLELVAVVDWEFAHAGHPFTDLGNLLRFERQPAYVEAVLEAWCAIRGGEPASAQALARAADLWALVDLAAREGSGPVAHRAAQLLRGIAVERDPGADAGWTPPDTDA